jgi:hypothetical protein
MMRMSKDYRSAGLRWLLPLVDAGLGGHGRPLGLFCSCFILSINLCFSWLLPQTIFCEGIRRGPVDNVEDQPLSSSFLVITGVAADHFSWRYFPYLLVNEERAALYFNHGALEICSLSWKHSPSARRAPRQKRRENGASRGSHFSLSF